MYEIDQVDAQTYKFIWIWKNAISATLAKDIKIKSEVKCLN